ncbi:hypothetical protein D3C71_1602860 [compost metagenome]
MAPDQSPCLLQALRIFKCGYPLVHLFNNFVADLAFDQLVSGAVRIRQNTQADRFLRNRNLRYSSITFLPFPNHHEYH